MKVYCDHCQQNLKTSIREPFDKFHIGKTICPFCHKENKRYISEVDILLYFLLSSFIYSCGLIAVVYILDNVFTTSIPLAILLFVILFFLGYLTSDNLAKYIYLKAPFKADWKTKDLKEDRFNVTRRTNQQFLLFIGVSLTIGLSGDMLSIYLLLISTMFVYNIIKIYLLLKKEESIINPQKPNANN